jgi:hypothetical protein
LKEDSYEVKITGLVTSPLFNQSAIIYLKPVRNITRIEEKIKMVKDLFQENPECLDLTELILEAEKELGEGNMDRARELTQKALDNCRDMIKYYANVSRQPVVPFAKKLPMSDIIIAFLTIAIITLAVYHFMSRKIEKEVERKRRGKTKGVIMRT